MGRFHFSTACGRARRLREDGEDRLRLQGRSFRGFLSRQVPALQKPRAARAARGPSGSPPASARGAPRGRGGGLGLWGSCSGRRAACLAAGFAGILCGQLVLTNFPSGSGTAGGGRRPRPGPRGVGPGALRAAEGRGAGGGRRRAPGGGGNETPGGPPGNFGNFCLLRQGNERCPRGRTPQPFLNLSSEMRPEAARRGAGPAGAAGGGRSGPPSSHGCWRGPRVRPALPVGGRRLPAPSSPRASARPRAAPGQRRPRRRGSGSGQGRPGESARGDRPQPGERPRERRGAGGSRSQPRGCSRLPPPCPGPPRWAPCPRPAPARPRCLPAFGSPLPEPRSPPPCGDASPSPPPGVPCPDPICAVLLRDRRRCLVLA